MIICEKFVSMKYPRAKKIFNAYHSHSIPYHSMHTIVMKCSDHQNINLDIGINEIIINHYPPNINSICDQTKDLFHLFLLLDKNCYCYSFLPN